MTTWPSTKAARVLAALLRIGWTIKRTTGSHRVLARPGWPDFVFAFHEAEEIGPHMLARLGRHTGLPQGTCKPRLARERKMTAVCLPTDPLRPHPAQPPTGPAADRFADVPI